MSSNDGATEDKFPQILRVKLKGSREIADVQIPPGGSTEEDDKRGGLSVMDRYGKEVAWFKLDQIAGCWRVANIQAGTLADRLRKARERTGNMKTSP